MHYLFVFLNYLIIIEFLFFYLNLFLISIISHLYLFINYVMLIELLHAHYLLMIISDIVMINLLLFYLIHHLNRPFILLIFIFFTLINLQHLIDLNLKLEIVINQIVILLFLNSQLIFFVQLFINVILIILIP